MLLYHLQECPSPSLPWGIPCDTLDVGAERGPKENVSTDVVSFGGCLLEVKDSDLFHLDVFISAANNGTHAGT